MHAATVRHTLPTRLVGPNALPVRCQPAGYPTDWRVRQDRNAPGVVRRESLGGVQGVEAARLALPAMAGAGH